MLVFFTTVMKIHQVPHKILATSLLGTKEEPWVEGNMKFRKGAIWVKENIDFRMGGVRFNLLYKSSKYKPYNLEGSHRL